MGREEARVLAHDEHDAGGDDGLLLFAVALVAEAEQVLYDAHEETLLGVGWECAADGADGPAERVELGGVEGVQGCVGFEEGEDDLFL